MLLDDVDFTVSSGLSDPDHYASILRQTRQGKAVVLPAFEPADALGIKEGTRVALRAVHGENCGSERSREILVCPVGDND